MYDNQVLRGNRVSWFVGFLVGLLVSSKTITNSEQSSSVGLFCIMVVYLYSSLNQAITQCLQQIENWVDI